MRTLGAAALAVAMLLPASPAAADHDIGEARAETQRYEARVAQIEARLAELLRSHEQAQQQESEASLEVARAFIEEQHVATRARKARHRFNQRARQAYMRGPLPDVYAMLAMFDIRGGLRVAPFLQQIVQADRDGLDDLGRAKDAAERHREEIDRRKQELLRTRAKLSSLKQEITVNLKAEQALLDEAREDLARLEAQRKARLKNPYPAPGTPGGVSLAVERARSARQKILDAKLAALLEFYAPGSGPEPFLPDVLRATGIVSTGLASWYGPGFHGRRASSGATFDANQLTAASRVLPFGTLLKVSFRGKAAVVVITDRGPYVPPRVLDLSRAAAEAIGMTGVQEVRMEVVVPKGEAPPFP